MTASWNYASILGERFVPPITTLLDQLFREPYSGTTEVQAGARENGYAVSSCLLLVVMLESFIAHARSMTKIVSARQKRQPLDFLRAAYPGCPMIDDVNELFVLRDAIAHNHIWRVWFETDRGRWMRVRDAVADSLSGDKKWEASVDMTLRVTKRLKLNIQPTIIHRHDVEVVLGKVLATLKFIDGQEDGRLGIGSLRGDFRDETDIDLWWIHSRISELLHGDPKGRSRP